MYIIYSSQHLRIYGMRALLKKICLIIHFRIDNRSFCKVIWHYLTGMAQQIAERKYRHQMICLSVDHILLLHTIYIMLSKRFLSYFQLSHMKFIGNLTFEEIQSYLKPWHVQYMTAPRKQLSYIAISRLCFIFFHNRFFLQGFPCHLVGY